MQVIYYRDGLFPKCRYCGERLDCWVHGLEDEIHTHPGCAGRAMADDSFDRNRILFEEAQKLRAELRAEKKRICSA